MKLYNHMINIPFALSPTKMCYKKVCKKNTNVLFLWCWKSWKIPIKKKLRGKWLLGGWLPLPSLTSYLPIPVASLITLSIWPIWRKPNHGMTDKSVKLTKKSLLCWCKCNLVALLCTVALIMLSNIWDLWPLRHFLRVIRKHGLTNKKTKTKTMTNTFWEHL